MDVIQSLKWRYAVKKFDSQKLLSDQKLAVLTEAFNLTATSYGLQPLRLVIVSDKELQKKLTKAAMNQSQVAQASHILVLCVEQEVKAPYVEDYFDNVKETRNTPETILKPFKEMLKDKFEKQSQAKTQQWAINQAYLAMGNLLTVCALEEIDACPMEGFEPAQFEEILGLNEMGLNAALVLPVGYRAADDIFADFKKVRRSTDETIIKL